MDDSADAIIEGIISLVYFMRGSITYEEMMRRTPGERDKISRFVKKRLESQKDSHHPVY